MPADPLYDKKVPVWLTAEQVAWLNEQRWNRRMENRSQVIRQLIDDARGQTDIPDRRGGTAPTIKPFTVEGYPGLGMAPALVPHLIATGASYYSTREIVEALGYNIGTIEVGRKAAIGLVMKACGFRPVRELTPEGEREEGWQAI